MAIVPVLLQVPTPSSEPTRSSSKMFIVRDSGDVLVMVIVKVTFSPGSLTSLEEGAFRTVNVGSTSSLTETNNLDTNNPNFVDRNGYDYRPTSTTPGINAGVSPGSANGFDLTPIYHYLRDLNFEARPEIGIVDIGAYEFYPETHVIWTVNDTGGADFDNIQAAIDVASHGDTIKVAGGTYTTNSQIGLFGKNEKIGKIAPPVSCMVNRKPNISFCNTSPMKARRSWLN